MPAVSFLAPVLVAGLSRAVAITTDGEIVEMPPRELADFLQLRHPLGDPASVPPVLCHAPACARRLGLAAVSARDVLELFAFVRPAQFCLPTPRGVAEAMGITVATGTSGEVEALQAAAEALLDELTNLEPEAAREIEPIAQTMARAGWSWGPDVLDALDAAPAAPSTSPTGLGALRVWIKLSEWQEEAPSAPPASWPVFPAEARARLDDLVNEPGVKGAAEVRPQQADYTSAAAEAFAPRDVVGEPRIVLAEAGTGVGKTLGYIAPASLWAEKNGGAVWLSTYTRNLQRQLDSELDRLHPDPKDKADRVVIRKGRENYLCLLNMEEQVNRAAMNPREAIGAGLMARWVRATRDGDMVGGDFPSWLAHLLGYAPTLGLADRRGECIYAACDHWRKCFIEKTVRRARHADIVVANHALVMAQAAFAGLDDANVPTRYVFDEGHHLFDAADSAFSAQLSGRETAELRRWLLGAEANGGRRRDSRARGLAKRVGDLLAGDTEMETLLAEALRAAKSLPGEGWMRRIAGNAPAGTDGAPRGATEQFLSYVRQQVLARAPTDDSAYSLEADKAPPVDGLAAAARELDNALHELQSPLAKIGARLARLVEEDADKLDATIKQRIEGTLKSLERRAMAPLIAWRAMLTTIDDDTPPDFVDWFALDRMDGRESDVGMHRHWVDPTVPFSRAVLAPAHGALITSATLRDSGGAASDDMGWPSAEARTGTRHLPNTATRAAVPSPFDYARQTRVIVVNDVSKTNPAAVAAAYRSLFLASGGGGLGLFTSIARLRDVHKRIAPVLEENEITLLAQHVDGLDTSTLVDIFRAEEDSCLLGTDAVRDGVDVPGRSLRLIVFDRVPWPRPDILHRARRSAFGGKAWDEMLTRLRLKQAYGRLIRRAGDAGVFVMLDSALPSRLASAFPAGVPIERMGLADAVRLVREFLHTNVTSAAQSGYDGDA